MDHFWRDTIIYAMGVSILGAMFAFITLDYYWSRGGGTTFSARMRAFWIAHQSRPFVWLQIGVIVGFALGIIVGFILGHLFWPQFVGEP